MVASLREHGDAVNGGNLSSAERMLHSQAVALNAIFGELDRRSALNMGEHLSATEIYMRLALKAQGQSRATLETLAVMKNPPVVFAKQMNVANGPQQVNNSAAPAKASPRTLEIESEPNELSGGSHELRQDAAASQATSGAHSQVEAVGAINRATQP